MGRPRPEEYPSRATYRWALRNWRCHQGGGLLGTLAIAIFFGLPSGSVTVLWVLIAFAIVATMIARSKQLSRRISADR
jgi:hypothetical protein